MIMLTWKSYPGRSLHFMIEVNLEWEMYFLRKLSGHSNFFLLSKCYLDCRYKKGHRTIRRSTSTYSFIGGLALGTRHYLAACHRVN